MKGSKKLRLFPMGLVLMGMLGAPSIGAENAPPASSPNLGIRLPADYCTPASLTFGIQEAIDSLPADGGTVYLPVGKYLLENPIMMKDNVTLRGAGKGTVLRKAPVFMVKLTEDAKQGQNFIVVADVSKLKPGMTIALGHDDMQASGFVDLYPIAKLEAGNRVLLRNKTLAKDFPVAKNARLMNLTMGIWPKANCVIADLMLDGAAATQMPEESRRFASMYQLPNGIYPVGAATKVEHCWVHDWLNDGIQVNSTESYVIIRDCHIYNNGAIGIHTGGGPRTIITQNNIYSNTGCGIYFCYGNRALIVTENFIYDNAHGIGGLDAGDPKRDTTQDKMSILANNIIYRNKGAGINTGRSPYRGPKNFVISGNVIENNQLAPSHKADPCAGIVLVNAENCVVTGNQVVDDQDSFERALFADAKPGDKTIRMARDYNDHIDARFPRAGLAYVIKDAEGRETCIVSNVSRMADQTTIELTVPLQREYRLERKARLKGIKTQAWGIVSFWVGQPEFNRGNVLSGNVVSGNRIGGIFWSGTNMEVSGNVGRVCARDESQPVLNQLNPTNAVIPEENENLYDK